jgi:hypothetical protein
MQNNKFEIVLLGNYIFRMKIFSGASLEVSDAEAMHEYFGKISNGNKYCILVDALSDFTSTPEVRAKIATAEYASRRIATAFVTKSMANRLVGNFFIQFNKPATPTKLFSDEESALVWLNEHIAISQSKLEKNSLSK